MREELLKGLSEEQIKKIEDCKSSEEVLNLAKAEGIELTDEQLEAVSGGGCLNSITKCPGCDSKDVKETVEEYDNPGSGGGGTTIYKYRCRKCGYKWEHKRSNAIQRASNASLQSDVGHNAPHFHFIETQLISS